MMDWWGAATTGVWVAGLAAVLAAASWGHWMASVEGMRFGEALGRRGVGWAIDVGFALFCTGLAAAEQEWWRRGLWGVLALMWVVQLGWGRRGGGR